MALQGLIDCTFYGSDELQGFRHAMPDPYTRSNLTRHESVTAGERIICLRDARNRAVWERIETANTGEFRCGRTWKWEA